MQLSQQYLHAKVRLVRVCVRGRERERKTNVFNQMNLNEYDNDFDNYLKTTTTTK